MRRRGFRERFGDARFEFLDFPAIGADNVMMVVVAVELKIYGVFMEVGPAQYIFLLKRGERAVYRDQIGLMGKFFENILGTERIAFFRKKFEDRDARRRDLETLRAQKIFNFLIAFFHIVDMSKMLRKPRHDENEYRADNGEPDDFP